MKLLWKDIQPTGAAFHLARKTISGAAPRRPHTHDFVELFWVNAGPGTHWINGRRRRLDRGDVIFIRADDAHDFAGWREHALTITNVAFARRELDPLRRRYGDVLSHWPWDSGAWPVRVRPPQHVITQIDRWTEAVAMRPFSRLELHWLLLTLLQHVEPAERRDDTGDGCPAWLSDAMARFDQPRHLAEGVRGLADLADRSPEHVTRTLRRHLGKPAVDWVNERRMTYAARELALTDRPILDLAIDVGLTDPSYFYQRFKRHFGTSPGAYRRSEQAIIRRGV